MWADSVDEKFRSLILRSLLASQSQLKGATNRYDDF